MGGSYKSKRQFSVSRTEVKQDVQIHFLESTAENGFANIKRFTMTKIIKLFSIHTDAS
jgi:hypothetical protein